MRTKPITFAPQIKIDWIERKTGELLKAAKRSGFFDACIADAEEFHADGYCWDVALAMSCRYWCS